MRVNVRELFAANKRSIQGCSNSDTSLNTNPMEPAASQLDLNSDKSYVQLSTQYSQTDLEDPHLTLADVREKMRREAAEREAKEAAAKEEAEKESKEKEAAESECFFIWFRKISQPRIVYLVLSYTWNVLHT